MFTRAMFQKAWLLAVLPIFFFISSVTVSAQDVTSKSYIVNTEDSYIHIYTGVAGLGRALAHSHLIAIRDINGEAHLDEEMARASLAFSPSNFLVDDDSERAKAADDSFREPVSENIKIGTKKNMLSELVLDADSHPEIILRISTPRSEVDEAQTFGRNTAFIVEINFKGVPYTMALPAQLEISETSITASGDFSLDHSDIGLKPFSAAGGLARVAESLRFEFEIVASLIL